jgi:hypothetical protein
MGGEAPSNKALQRRLRGAAERHTVRQTIWWASLILDGRGRKLVVRKCDMRNLARALSASARRLRLRWPLKHALILVLMVGGGCTSAVTHSISTSEFQRSCSVDSDCVPVYEGTLTCCGLGECPNDAINQFSYTAYKSTAASRKPSCEGVPCLAITIICKSAAICTGGTCAFEQSGTDAAGLD